MALSTNFFNEDTIHGKVKRFMYMRHLQAFVPITQQSRLRTLIYDAFAGPGRYGENWPDAIEELGSPLIALRVVIEDFIKRKRLEFSFNRLRNVNSDIGKYERYVQKVMKTFRKRSQKSIIMPDLETDVILNFSEADEDNYFELFLNVIHVFKFYGIAYKRSCDPCGVITVRSSDTAFPIGCNIALSEFKHTFLPDCGDKSRLMTFIDPFGFSDMPMSHVQNFFGQGKEVLITFMSSFLNRFKKLEKNKITVIELFGFDDEYSSSSSSSSLSSSSSSSGSYDSQYHKLLKDSKEMDGITRCTQFYENQLMRRANSDMVLTFEIRDSRNIRRFHLIFITNHQKGLETMKEAMNRGTQSPEGLSLSEYMILRKGIPLSLVNIQNNELVAETIFNEFKGKENVPISQIKHFILLDTPFVFRKKALTILQKEKNPRLIKVVNENNEHPRRRWSFPDGTEWLLTFRDRDENITATVSCLLLVSLLVCLTVLFSTR
ncbi:hypothetical protein CHS0354_024733 [Potamilus streckersoni]|uniref:Three-Cys-motif partner protein TcmP n=1 Tax=Potamilus streckersoni TaxID=2493646 RepID=A0AAE0RWX4_9BIVA|nr:hypothetical protein CHS0354_024733 [Potamilus streckersoni]